VRSSDIVCRYGGEEFLLWLPNTQAAAALDVAEELLRGYAASPWLAQGRQAVHATLSIGVAVFPDHATQADSLIAAADRALYQAKHEGRNRVCMARSRVQT
jgi:diguanylate cyclase (GGDEF)-like protein